MNKAAYYGKNPGEKIIEAADLDQFSELIRHQTESFGWLVEKGISQALSQTVIKDREDAPRIIITLSNPKLVDPPMSPELALRTQSSYSGLLTCDLALERTESGEKLVRNGVTLTRLPIMTEEGIFIISGSKRTIVSQIVKAPGIYFALDQDARSGAKSASASIVSPRGARVKLATDLNGAISAHVGNSRKIGALALARALGLELQNILDQLDIADPTGQTTAACLERTNFAEDRAACLKEVFSAINPRAPFNEKLAQDDIFGKLCDPESYSLSELGRKRLNAALHYEADSAPRGDTLDPQDLLAAMRETVKTQLGKRQPDDPDHLGNKRVRRSGELIAEAIARGLKRSAKAAEIRLYSTDSETLQGAKPLPLITFDALRGEVKKFFNHSPLCQYLDDNNPLSQITHLRRITALGPGGLDRRQAGVDVRDVHHSYYGKICPIESPEGQNIGLVNALAFGARIDSDGYIRSPYRKIEKTMLSRDAETLLGRTVSSDIRSLDGKPILDAGQKIEPPHLDPLHELDPETQIQVTPYLTERIDWLDAFSEERFGIGQADPPTNELAEIIAKSLEARKEGQATELSPQDLDYCDLSTSQMFSVSSLLIPFLSHNDANRALMGANMQRQALPLINPDPPVVATGMEKLLTQNPGHSVIAKEDGIVTSATAESVSIWPNDGTPENRKAVTYRVWPIKKSNTGTLISQKTAVRNGQIIKAGDTLADGYASTEGEAALGQNVLVGYLSWDGYNYEDSIVVSESVIASGKFASAHVKTLTLEIPSDENEKITIETPNLPRQARNRLDSRGIIKVGSWIKPGNTLVAARKRRDRPETIEKAFSIDEESEKLVALYENISLTAGASDYGVVIEARLVSGGPDDPLPQGAKSAARVSIATVKSLAVGDKMSGRHGNKGVVSAIMPPEDMPMLEDGEPIEIALNPLGIPSRMNLGQLLETHLGMAARETNQRFTVEPFGQNDRQKVEDALATAWAKRNGVELPHNERPATAATRIWLGELAADHDAETIAYLARLRELEGDPPPASGKYNLRDGRTGEILPGAQTVGIKHMLKLSHLAADKMHARSTGPYQAITKQPLGGKSMRGGQRLGEMEVWALASYGANETLAEALTIRSDDISGREQAFANLIKGDDTPIESRPESFRILALELAALRMNLMAQDPDGSWREPASYTS